MTDKDDALLNEFKNLVQDISQNVIENSVLQEFKEINADIIDGAENIKEMTENSKRERQETFKLKKIIKKDLEKEVTKAKETVNSVNNSLKEVKNFYREEKHNIEKSRKDLILKQEEGLEKISNQLEKHNKQFQKQVDNEINNIKNNSKKRFLVLIFFNIIILILIGLVSLYPDSVIEFLSMLGL